MDKLWWSQSSHQSSNSGTRCSPTARLHSARGVTVPHYAPHPERCLPTHLFLGLASRFPLQLTPCSSVVRLRGNNTAYPPGGPITKNISSQGSPEVKEAKPPVAENTTKGPQAMQWFPVPSTVPGAPGAPHRPDCAQGGSVRPVRWDTATPTLLCQPMACGVCSLTVLAKVTAEFQVGQDIFQQQTCPWACLYSPSQKARHTHGESAWALGRARPFGSRS